MDTMQNSAAKRRNIQARLARAWRVVWPILRQVLGWICILIGLVGLVLPILQGVIFLVIGIALVGRRNIVIRWCAVHFKWLVRRWAALDTPVIGWFGRLALRAQHQTSRQRRRLHWWYVERRQRAMPASRPPNEHRQA